MSKIATAEWYADWVRGLPASTEEEKMRNLEAACLLEEFAKRVPRWISVEERLPEYNELVLCVGAKGGMFLGRHTRLFAGDNTAFFYVPNARAGRYATHWMPLPEPPEEDA